VDPATSFDGASAAPPGLQRNGEDPNGTLDPNLHAPREDGGPLRENGSAEGHAFGTSGGSSEGKLGGSERGTIEGTSSREPDVLDDLTTLAGILNFEAGGRPGGTDGRGIPGGTGDEEASWFDQVLYTGLTGLLTFGFGAILAMFKVGARVARGANAARRVLVVGEAHTFEYSMNLAKRNPSWEITATSHGPAAPMSGLPANLTVQGGVDATRLGEHFAAGSFDDIVFNAPRANQGWFSETGDLVDDFLRSGRDVLREGGAARVSSSGGMPGTARLGGHAKGGTSQYPYPAGYSPPAETIPYAVDSAFGVPYTPRSNAGKPLPTAAGELVWYIFR